VVKSWYFSSQKKRSRIFVKNVSIMIRIMIPVIPLMNPSLLTSFGNAKNGMTILAGLVFFEDSPGWAIFSLYLFIYYTGLWLSWESAAFASQRSRVRIPSGPPSLTTTA
jgi:hypothetical protein